MRKTSSLLLGILAILALLVVARFAFVPKEQPMPQVQSPLPPDLPEPITGEVPMTAPGGVTDPCDINLDERCDAADFELFANTFGKCLGDSGYSVSSDANADGCVTATDQQMLFPANPENPPSL